MDYEKAKIIALKLAHQYTLEMPFDDRVQECLLCWVETRHRDLPNKYIYASMRNRMIDIWRSERSKKHAKAYIDVADSRDDPLEVLLKKEAQVVIAVPKRTQLVHKFVRVMIENDLRLGKTCDDVGISYSKGISWWRRGKKIIKRMAENGDWMNEDVIAVV